MIEKYIYHAFDMTGSALYTFHYSNEYILFLETSKAKQWLHLFEQLAQKHAPLLKIGIGHTAPLSQQYKSYQSAKIAADSLFSNEYIAEFDSLDLEILLAGVAEDAQNFYLAKTMHALAEKDLELLKVYFSLNMSLKDTCEQLFLHKNTLQYRLDKIHKITGYNPRSFKDAAVLYIGLKLLTKDS